LTHQQLLRTGYGSVPNQETKVCPTEESSSITPQSAAATKGQDTVWFVENTSKTPVVILYVLDGVEYPYSAVHRKQQDDPEALVQPNEWKAIHAFEGDVFHVRSSGEHAELLLQHRVGLIPIGAKPPSPDVCAEPMAPALIETQEATRQPRAEYDWTTCNVVDLGFRNQGTQAVNGFWVDTVTCQEHLKFQLGLNAQSHNFAFDLDSNTKFEKSYVGHSFVFRTPDGDFVDSYTIQPTRVVDCPLRRRNEKVVIATAAGSISDGVTVELPIWQADTTNATASSETLFLASSSSAPGDVVVSTASH
jgi:hypothetical protein